MCTQNLWLTLSCVVALGIPTLTLGDDYVIANDTLRVEAVRHEASFTLVIQARQGAGWTTVLENTTQHKGGPWEKELQSAVEDLEVAWEYEGQAERQVGWMRQAEVSDDGETLVLTGSAGPHHVEQRITLVGPGHLHVSVTDRIEGSTEQLKLGRLMNHYYFKPEGRGMGYALPLDFAWLPSLHWHKEDVSGEFLFRSPVAMVVSRGFYAAIVPDLDILAQGRPVPHALDLRSWEHAGSGAYGLPRLSYGLCPWRIDRHVYTTADDPVPVPTSQLRYGFDLFVGATETAAPVVRRVTQHAWQRYGQKYFRDIRPQVLPFGEYAKRYSYRFELPRWARRVERNGQECYGINNAFRRGANFHAWENDLHMGFGILHYGQKWQDEKLRRIGEGILRLSLDAPSKSGAFPCVFNFEEDRWEGSLYWTSWPASPYDGYDTQAMGVSAWWRLYWHEHFPELAQQAEILEKVEEYAHFLAEQQLPSGAIPTYFDADLKPAEQLRVSATTSIGGAVLAKVAQQTGDAHLKEAALRAGQFMQREILPRTNFQDFEVFYSCSRKPLFWVDPINNILPINNLAIQWTADQFLALYHLTQDEQWLEQGEYVMSLLSLFQQVWAPPYYNAYLYGGFGVMNTDGEWNDGRQARFVPTYVDYYRATHNPEYLQRAVAACRASFAAMDMRENHANDINHLTMPYLGTGRGYSPESIMHGRAEAHTGAMQGGHTGFNWGPGGGLGASAYLERHFGSVWIDSGAKLAIPIDGLGAEIQAWQGTRIDLEVTTPLANLPLPYQAPREVLVRWGPLSPGTYRVTVNGVQQPPRTAEDLADGLRVRVE